MKESVAVTPATIIGDDLDCGTLLFSRLATVRSESLPMNRKDPILIALQFNECINKHDLNGLALLMTDDHAFVDREGVVHKLKQAMVQGWEQFFKTFPDYRNTFHRVESKNNLVTILGYAYWSESQPYDPAIWTAIIVDDLVQEWRIYDDSEANRKRFNLV